MIFESPIIILKDKLSRTDFADCYTVVVPLDSFSSAKDVATAAGKLAPQWLKTLMDIRNTVVKPFGLKVVEETKAVEKDWLSAAPIVQETKELIVCGLNDSHLDFLACIRLESVDSSQAQISIETVVKFNNGIGKGYFFFVKPFHKIIIQSLLKRLSESVRTDRK